MNNFRYEGGYNRRAGKCYEVARRCREWRQKKGIHQGDIASDLGLAQSAVSAFESGVNFSGRILLWYVSHGLDLSDLSKEGSEKHVENLNA